jgi:purine-binding chemotaxis protein CheW
VQRIAAEASRADPLVQLCAFRVGAEEYVVDIMRVREIVAPLPVTSLPGAPPFVEGVLSLRGDVVPVVDLRRRLGLDPAPRTRRSRMLVVNAGPGRLALLVDAVSEVVRIPRSAIRPAPAFGPRDASRLFLGVCGSEAEKPRRPTRALPTAGRGAPARPDARGSAPRLRLLLNVKALLDPATPEELAALRQLAAAGVLA